jgi:hypothetical protein
MCPSDPHPSPRPERACSRRASSTRSHRRRMRERGRPRGSAQGGRVLVCRAVEPAGGAHRRCARWLRVALVGIVLIGCGRSSRTVPIEGVGGRAGTGGAGTGVAGMGVAGMGVAGMGVAGMGGAGVATTAGAGGTGGELGYCDEVPRWDIGCIPNNEIVFESTCSKAATCDALQCGAPWSMYDEQGCERSFCRSSDECATDERCLSPALVGRFEALPGYFEGCSVDACECFCSHDPFIYPGRGFCFPAAEYPPTSDCPVAGVACADAANGLRLVSQWLEDSDESTSDMREAMAACGVKLEQAVARCERNGGSGGEGGSK